MKRIESLDYLRGLMALTIMSYHYLSWGVGRFDGGSLWGKLGIYSVSIFFILSGLSLYLAYEKKLSTISNIFDFYVKRFFRIIPLFWLAITLTITLRYGLKGITYDYTKLGLNYSMLFSVLDPRASIPVGGWSIGNEVFYYCLFPIAMMLSAVSRLVFFSFVIISLLTSSFFAYYIFDASQPLSSQGNHYINPLNNIFLFAFGMAIGHYRLFLKRLMNRIAAAICFLLFTALFVFLDTAGDRINLLSGHNRLILSFCCIGAVASLYMYDPQIKGIPGKVLHYLGECSYSIYMLHPIVALVFSSFRDQLGYSKIMGYSIAFVVTLLLSGLIYRVVELPFMRLGTALIKRNKIAL